jgi:hypothetical protein
MKIARACAANCFFAFMLFNAAASGLAQEPGRSVKPASEIRPDNNSNMETKKIGLAIHGGAGTIERSKMTPEKEREYRAGLERALTAGYEILKQLCVFSRTIRTSTLGAVLYLPAPAQTRWTRPLWTERH